ncbi:hypothetical protein CEXT_390931, partial [Caerostris extrusa]
IRAEVNRAEKGPINGVENAPCTSEWPPAGGTTKEDYSPMVHFVTLTADYWRNGQQQWRHFTFSVVMKLDHRTVDSTSATTVNKFRGVGVRFQVLFFHSDCSFVSINVLNGDSESFVGS